VIDLRSIATPFEDCVSLRVGEVVPEVLARLEQSEFTQAPVLDHDGRPLGVIATNAARAILDRHATLESDSQEIIRDRLPVACAVERLLASLKDASGLLVEDDGEACGLVALSDLNRHGFRSVLYGVFAELEALLARLIDVAFPDPWVWLESLREDLQARLVGYWEVSRRRGVNIGPQAGATTTELLRVLAWSEELRRSLGYPSRSAFDRATSSIPDHRNMVMHPVRPLLLDPSEVVHLQEALEHVLSLIDRSRAVLASRGYGSRVHWL